MPYIPSGSNRNRRKKKKNISCTPILDSLFYCCHNTNCRIIITKDNKKHAKTLCVEAQMIFLDDYNGSIHIKLLRVTW
jgi:hypothetical protein